MTETIISLIIAGDEYTDFKASIDYRLLAHEEIVDKYRYLYNVIRHDCNIYNEDVRKIVSIIDSMCHCLGHFKNSVYQCDAIYEDDNE